MILALSRLEVTAGRDEAVRAAVAGSSHAADGTPGLLGLEVFTDTRDATVLFLVTRWTDEASFRAWHAGESPRLSRAGVARPLRLDPSAAEVLVLDRLDAAGGSPRLEGMAGDAARLLAAFLSTSRAVAYLAAGPDGTIRHCNGALAARLRRTVSELVGQPLWDHLTVDDGAMLRRRLEEGCRDLPERVLLNLSDADHVPHTLECRLDVEPDGFTIVGEPPQGQDDVIERLFRVNNEWALLSRERAQLLARERTARAEVERLSRAKDRFLAVLGHELRNPLGSILSATQAIDRIEGQTPEAIRLRSIVARQTRHLARLVDDLLDVARLTAGKMVLQRRPVDVRESARRYLDLIQASGRARLHEVTLVTDPEAVVVDGDPDRLQQIIGNLVDNALKYSPAGGKLRVSVGADAGVAVVRVQDHGVGLAPDALQAIFEPFAQIGAVGGTQEGLGLGLAVARGLVEQHGGNIRAVSPGLGQGAEFIVELPLVKGAAPAPGDSAPRLPGPRRRIVLVEDYPDGREALLALLVLDGHQVRVAVDGWQGLDLILSERPEAALIDIGLPGIDGFEVARRVREAPGGAALFLIALTGYGQPGDVQRALEAGFDLHLVKPVDANALEQALSRLEAGPESR